MNEDNIITHQTFGLVPHERIIFGDTVMFEEENKV
jgi:hypothetical protein